MNTAKAKTLLQNCETGLRRLLEEAAGQGDYDGVETLATLARQTARMAATIEPNGTDAASLPRETTIPARPATTAPRKPAKSSGKAREYPRFVKQRDQLIKIGWSKKEKKEYQHKAPWHAVQAVAQAVAKCGGDGRLFQTADLMPLVDPTDGVEVPVYQVYLTLAWLRELGLVDQHGRQGNSVGKPAELAGEVERGWGGLLING